MVLLNRAFMVWVRPNMNTCSFSVIHVSGFLLLCIALYYISKDTGCWKFLFPLLSVTFPSYHWSVFTNINQCWQSINFLSKSFKLPPKGQNISDTSERGIRTQIQTVLSNSQSKDSDPALNGLKAQMINESQKCFLSNKSLKDQPNCAEKNVFMCWTDLWPQIHLNESKKLLLHFGLRKLGWIFLMVLLPFIDQTVNWNSYSQINH